MTRPGIEPRSPGPLANTLTARPMSGTNELKLSSILTIYSKQNIYKQYKVLPVYQVKFERLTGVLERIAVIF